MKKVLFIICLFNYQLFGQSWNWAKSIDPFSAGLAYSRTPLTEDDDQNVYISTYSWHSDGSGSADSACIIKLDVSGTELWRKYISGDLLINEIAFADNHLYVTGQFRNTLTMENNTVVSAGLYDGFLAKYDGSGNCIWLRRFGGGSDDVSNSLCSDSQNNIWVTGGYSDTADFSSGSLICQGDVNMFITKYDSGGNLLYIKSAGSASNSGTSKGRKIRCGIDDNLYILGEWNEMLLDTFYLPNCSCSPYTEPEFLTMIDKYGVVHWLNGGLREDMTYFTSDLSVDEAGFVYTAGAWNWTFDAHYSVNKFGLNGQKLWANTIDKGYGYSLRSGPVAVKDDTVYSTVVEEMSGGKYLLLEKIDSSGILVNIDTIQVDVYAVPRNIYYNKSHNHFILNGIYEGELTFGNNSINSMDGKMFVAKYADGTLTSVPESFFSEDSELLIYPNPTDSRLTIKCRSFSPNYEMKIYNTIGELISSRVITSSIMEVDLSVQKKGIYFLQINSDNDRIVRKVVLQ
ncbi:MAG: hypothetical protein K0Q95_2260 [Bacteroidota bacterium]|nr:hypothetical protein [Bacteroidota bacterium]